MNVTLAIYITLCAVAVVAVAQLLYWKLVIARDRVVADEGPEAAWVDQPVLAYQHVQEYKPVQEYDTVRVDERLLAGV